MPRGVYDRTKSKAKAAAPVAAKPAPAKKAAAVQTKTAKSTKTHSAVAASPAKAERQPIIVDAHVGFQILGANLSTLSEAYAKLESSGQGFVLALSKEIHETVKTLTGLRESVFGISAVATEQDEVAMPPVDAEDEVIAPAPIAPPATVSALPQPTHAAPPVLPTGNASPFQPPAPPALPHH